MAATRIKICGITRPQDALVVAGSGADALGLVFYSASPRAVSVEQALAITSVLPPFVTVVALFVDEPVASIERILSTVPIDLIQFHGTECPQVCQQFERPWIKALRVKPGLDIAAECDRYHRARGVLLDSFQAGVPGGTGKSPPRICHCLSYWRVDCMRRTLAMRFERCVRRQWMSVAVLRALRGSRTQAGYTDLSQLLELQNSSWTE